MSTLKNWNGIKTERLYFVPNDWIAERNRMSVLERGAGSPKMAGAWSGGGGGGCRSAVEAIKNRLERGAEIKKGLECRSANAPGRPPLSS